jgi:hypothetical protein
VGAVYVLLYSRPADGLLGHAHPAIRDILSVSTAEMGIVLFGLSIGSMSGILCSAWLVKRFGASGDPHHHVLCRVRDVVLSVALWFASPVLFALG